MKTIDILLVFLAVILFAACNNLKLSEGRYDITLVGKCLPGDSDNSFILDEGVCTGYLRVNNLPDGTQRASLTTELAFFGLTYFESGVLDGKGHFIGEFMNPRTWVTQTDTCYYGILRNGRVIIEDKKGVLSLTRCLRINAKTEKDKKYVAIYELKKNKRIKRLTL